MSALLGASEWLDTITWLPITSLWSCQLFCFCRPEMSYVCVSRRREMLLACTSPSVVCLRARCCELVVSYDNVATMDNESGWYDDNLTMDGDIKAYCLHGPCPLPRCSVRFRCQGVRFHPARKVQTEVLATDRMTLWFDITYDFWL